MESEEEEVGGEKRGVPLESYSRYGVKFSFRCRAHTRCYVTVDRMRIMWAASFIRKVNNYTFPFVSQVGRQVYEVDGN